MNRPMLESTGARFTFKDLSVNVNDILSHALFGPGGFSIILCVVTLPNHPTPHHILFCRQMLHIYAQIGSQKPCTHVFLKLGCVCCFSSLALVGSGVLQIVPLVINAVQITSGLCHTNGCHLMSNRHIIRRFHTFFYKIKRFHAHQSDLDSRPI